MGAVRGVCLFIRFGEIEISEWVPSDEFVYQIWRNWDQWMGAVRMSLFVHQICRNWDQWMGAIIGVCLFIRFGEIEISEWVPSEEFVCSSDLEKLRSVNGCRQRSLFVHQICGNWDQWMGAVRWVCLFIRFGEIEISEWVPSGWVCLFIRFGEIEISEWVQSDEFVCSSDLEKLRSVNGCRQNESLI